MSLVLVFRVARAQAKREGGRWLALLVRESVLQRDHAAGAFRVSKGCCELGFGGHVHGILVLLQLQLALSIQTRLVTTGT